MKEEFKQKVVDCCSSLLNFKKTLEYTFSSVLEIFKRRQSLTAVAMLGMILTASCIKPQEKVWNVGFYSKENYPLNNFNISSIIPPICTDSKIYFYKGDVQINKWEVETNQWVPEEVKANNILRIAVSLTITNSKFTNGLFNGMIVPTEPGVLHGVDGYNGRVVGYTTGIEGLGTSAPNIVWTIPNSDTKGMLVGMTKFDLPARKEEVSGQADPFNPEIYDDSKAFGEICIRTLGATNGGLVRIVTLEGITTTDLNTYGELKSSDLGIQTALNTYREFGGRFEVEEE